MYVLGVDQGIANIGISLIEVDEDYYFIKVVKDHYISTSSKLRLGVRLNLIEKEFKDFVGDKEISCVFCEKLNSGLLRNVKHVTGILYMLYPDVDLIALVPSYVKKTVTGNGKAKKPEMMEKAGEITGREYISDHVADSFLIAYAGLMDKNKKNKNTKIKGGNKKC